MKRILLTTVAILTIASAAFPQAGSIGLFADVAGADCNLVDAAPDLCLIFIVHVNTTAVTASEWSVTNPACILATFLSDGSQFAVYIGTDPFTGRSVGYGLCLGAPIHAATLSYFCGGTTTACCYQGVIAHPVTGGPTAVDCANNLLLAAGGEGIWNSNAGCTCDVGSHASTWGAVKQLFQAE